MSPWAPLEDGQILDCGYGEFMCTPATADWLMNGGMTHINEIPVTLAIVDTLPAVNTVIVKWQAMEGNWQSEWAAYWQRHQAKENGVAA